MFRADAVVQCGVWRCIWYTHYCLRLLVAFSSVVGSSRYCCLACIHRSTGTLAAQSRGRPPAPTEKRPVTMAAVSKKAFMAKGVYTAIVTPFDVTGAVDWESLESLIKFQIEAGVAGIVPVSLSLQLHWRLSKTLAGQPEEEGSRIP